MRGHCWNVTQTTCYPVVDGKSCDGLDCWQTFGSVHLTLWHQTDSCLMGGRSDECCRGLIMSRQYRLVSLFVFTLFHSVLKTPADPACWLTISQSNLSNNSVWYQASDGRDHRSWHWFCSMWFQVTGNRYSPAPFLKMVDYFLPFRCHRNKKWVDIKNRHIKRLFPVFGLRPPALTTHELCTSSFCTYNVRSSTSL